MLNLKAYVRCYPALFHLRSGRTAQGRPLDVVELRTDCSAEATPARNAHASANINLAIIEAIANSDETPHWNEDSFFAQ